MDELQAKLNQETARVRWSELAGHFARGKVIRVSTELDLIEVAAAVAEDDAAAVGQWADSGRLGPASDAEAREWQERDAVLWAVVVKPFVLVQPSADEG